MKRIYQKSIILTLLFSLIFTCLPTNIVHAEENYLNDLHTYTFILEGATYQLPVKVSELEKAGWKLHSNEELSSFGISFTYMSKGNETIQVAIINPTTTSSRNYSDFIIFSIQGDNFTLPGNIKVGSTREEVRNAYGTPYCKDSTKKVEGLNKTMDAYYYMDYIDSDLKQKEFDSVTISGVTIYSDKDSKVTSIKMSYLDLDIKSLIDQNVPTIEYQEPTKLGISILSFQIQLEGDIYRIPAPFTSFLDNGWTIAGICDPNNNKLCSTTLPKYLYTGSSEYLRLTKNGHYLYVQVTNEDITTQKLENSTVTSISFTNTKTPKFTLPNKLNTLNTTQKVISTYKKDAYKTSTSKQKKTYTYYDFRTKDFPNKYHQHSDGYYSGYVAFTSTSGKVFKITMTHTTTDFISAIPVKVKEKAATINSNEDAKDFFCYSNFGSGYWQSNIGYVFYFKDDNTMDAYDAGAGNPWFLQCGDTIDAKATYSFDYKNNSIIIKDYDRIITIKYQIINSERVFITVDGVTREFTTSHVVVNENGPASVVENIALKKGSSKKLTPTLPTGVTYKVNYQSSNKKVATVSSSGTIKALRAGNVTVTTSVTIGDITKDYQTYVTIR